VSLESEQGNSYETYSYDQRQKLWESSVKPCSCAIPGFADVSCQRLSFDFNAVAPDLPQGQ